jgi:hypothetical protein
MKDLEATGQVGGFKVRLDGSGYIDVLGPSEADAKAIESAKRDLSLTDRQMVRVVDDLIDLLDSKGVISKSADLPQAVQDRLSERAAKRSQMP